MKKFSVKTIMPIVSVLVSVLIYNVIRNASATMTVSVQSKSLSAIDAGLYKLVTDNKTDSDPLPSEQKEFGECLEVSFDSGFTHEGKDVWGTNLVYHHPVRSYYAVGSAGPDKQFGTDDDIYLARSGDSRGMTHDLQKIMKQMETVVEIEKKNNASATTTPKETQAAVSEPEPLVEPEKADIAALTLEQAVKAFKGDEKVKRLVTDLLATSTNGGGNASAAARLGVGNTASGPAEMQPPTPKPRIEVTLESLNAEIASYTQFQQTFDQFLKQSDYEGLQPMLHQFVPQLEGGLVGTYVKGLPRDIEAVDGMLERFLQDMDKRKNEPIVLGAASGKIKEVVESMLVLDTGDTETVIDKKELQPKWILDHSRLGELAARDDLYGLGVMFMHRGRHREAEDLFHNLGEWHPGRERQASWEKIRTETEASQQLEEIKLALEGGDGSRAKALLTRVRNQYANTDILRLSEDLIAQWEESATQSIGTMNKEIQERLEKLASLDEGIRAKLETWLKDRTDKIEALYEEEMGDKVQEIAQLRLTKKKDSKAVRSTQITNLQREIRKIKQKRVDRMSELASRTRNLQRDHRNAYLRLRRKAGEGEEFTEQEAIRRLDVLGGAGQAQTADIEARLTPSSIQQTRHYVIEYNCTKEEAIALGVRLDAFYVSLSTMFSKSDRMRDKLEADDKKKLTVRYLKNRDAFVEYGKEHCKAFSEGWAAYYWSTDGTAEIVLYPTGSNFGSAYHEAFHQFMDRTIPNVGPMPRWFDEGLATYYGTSNFNQGKFSVPEKLDVNWAALAQKAIKDGSFISLESFLRITLADWNGENQELHYGEGYTLVHFFLNYPDKRVAKVFRVFIEELAESGKYEESIETAFTELNRGTLEMLWKDWINTADGDGETDKE
ncbi:MAG: hypothetical protein O3B01_30990 [Planctomycetota bacterium]|nr:hypothetical protein [Planctomycetota bacterium]